ncbi:MAG TPA: ABC transporter ATP-binding protein [Pseudogracilibacillus sp.]|nr:ABC transporter ATP-binding protein [Pseudogracilibacillus sp.]
MKIILDYVKPYNIHITIAYALTLFELVADLLFPLFLAIVINEGILLQKTTVVTKWGAMMLVVTLLTFTAGIVNSYYASHVSSQFAFHIRKDLFAKIQAFSYRQIAQYPTSTLVTRFTNDVRQIQQTIFMALRIMVRAPLMVIGSMLMAFYVNFSISFIFLFTVPLMLFFLFWVLQRGSNLFDRVQRSVDQVNRAIQENIAGMRIIRAFVQRSHEQTRFMTANERLARHTKKALRFIEASMPVLLFTMNISLLFILWYGNVRTIAGTTNVGDVVAIVNYALRIVMAISLFTFITLGFARAKASAQRVNSILTVEEEERTTKDDGVVTVPAGSITFQNVSFTYPETDKYALERVSFTIAANETVAFIGETGAGKTTIFQLIPKLYDVQDGVIYIDNMPLQSFQLEALRKQIGYVPQAPLLFTGTIKDNIAFGMKDASEEQIIHAAKVAQIHDTIMQFPEQYDTVVGQKGVNLSGGQKQRISIARAFIRKPKILLLDDSTSALDIATENRLLKALKQHRCTTLMITQKTATAKRADRIVLIQHGNVLANGSHEQLLKESEVYKQIVASQAEKEIPYV